MKNEFAELIRRIVNKNALDASASLNWMQTEDLAQAISQSSDWKELVQTKSKRDAFLFLMLKIETRRAIKHLKGKDGLPLFENVGISVDEGETIQVYKAVENMVIGDHEQVIRYRENRMLLDALHIKKHQRMLLEKGSVQLDLAFDLEAFPD